MRRLIRSRKEIWLDVGAGDVEGSNGWVAIDRGYRCDISWDLSRGLPFPDGSVSKIYSSHFLEHLSYEEALIFLQNCLRKLGPGGTISLAVPNARLYIEAYNSKEECALDERLFGYKPALMTTDRIDRVNYIAYMNGAHKWMYDEESLTHILAASGFGNVRIRQHDPGIDKGHRRYNSIYAAAEKL